MSPSTPTGLPPDGTTTSSGAAMGLIHIEMFATLDLVGQAPGGPDRPWAGSTRLGPDLAAAVREIRDRHENIKVVGSLDLVQALLREKLFDRLDLWVHPIVLGVGKKVFDGGAVPTNLTLLEPPAASPTGTVYLRYGIAEGTPGTGDMTAPDRGVERAD